MTVDSLPGADDTPAEAALRAEIRPWMEANASSYGPADRHNRMSDTEDYVAACRVWQRTLDDGGYGAPAWPVAAGGREFGANDLRILREEQSRFDVPVGAFSVGIGMVGPTLLAHGTHLQQDEHLAAMRRGDEVWCQLFSEPDAGSDLAALRTRAQRDGDEWVVTGSKVWTSGARHADMAILLARTDAGSSGPGGITYFLCDMHLPGVTVRPLVQINRAHHFNEVHLDGVRLPATAVLGDVGEGWKVARTTLGAERALIGTIPAEEYVQRLIAAARANGRLGDPRLRGRLASAYTRAAIIRMTSDRVLSAMRRGGVIGPEASVLKLSLSSLMAVIGDLAMDVLGADGLLEGDGPDGYGTLQDLFLNQWASRLGGGTEQIQRNLIGERVLGLPRDLRP